MSISDDKKISLVVLQHGLWGVKGHMGYIEKKLKEKYNDDSVYILNTSVNEAKYSYDGVDICGTRLAEEIESLVNRLRKTGQQVTRISLIGYSLGGLIVRYAIGVLGEKGFFNTIQPEYLITFATPHIGVKMPSASFYSKIFNYLSGRLVSRSGEQLQLIDKHEHNKAMLEILSDPDEIYFKTLSKFKYRRTYANISNDRTVPYFTAGMETKDYFYQSKGKLDIVLDETYNSIVVGFDIREPVGAGSSSKKAKKKKTVKTYLLTGSFYVLFPIVFPFFFVIAISTISVQGLLSRYRVSRLLSVKKNLHNMNKETLDHETVSESDRFVSGEILAGALDAINLPGDASPPSIKKISTGIDDYYCQVKPSKAVEEKSKILPFDETTIRIQKNLVQLDWQVVYVYIRTFNAHGGIICRQNIHTTPSGEATIQHFIDTTHF